MAKAGTDWPEVASVLRSFIHQLNLKGIRLRTFRGRWTRDFKYSHYHNKKELAEQYPDVFQASKLDSILFKITQRTFKIYRY